MTYYFNPCRGKTYKCHIMHAFFLQFSNFSILGALSFARLSLFQILGPGGFPFRSWASILTPSGFLFWIPWTSHCCPYDFTLSGSTYFHQMCFHCVWVLISGPLFFFLFWKRLHIIFFNIFLYTFSFSPYVPECIVVIVLHPPRQKVKSRMRFPRGDHHYTKTHRPPQT